MTNGLLRRLAERQHLLARRQIDRLAILDDVREVLAALQHGDVGERIAVEHDEIGELAGCKFADLAFEPDRVGIVVRRRLDRLERRVAAVFDENLQLLGVHLAVAHESVVAGISADQKFYAELARLVHQLAKEIEVPLHAIDVELHLLAADFLAELDHHGEEGRSGDDRHAGLGDGLEIAVAGEIGVNDPVDAGFGGGVGRAGAARMNADAQVAAMRFGDHGGDLFTRQHLRFAGAAVRHLDEVDAVLALPAHLGDHLGGGVAQFADRMVGRAFPRRLVILDAPIGHDHAAGDEHARPLHQAELYGVAHADIGEPGAARHRNSGDAGAQHFLYAARGLERGKFRPRGAAAFALALDRRIAVGDVAMRVDQARHDPLAGGVDHRDVAAVVERDVTRQRADMLDAVALDHDRVVAPRRRARTVDQGAVADDDGVGAHRLSLVCCLPSVARIWRSRNAARECATVIPRFSPVSRARANNRRSCAASGASGRLEPASYIQCRPASFLLTASMVLLTPNGLPQRMQANGSSSLRTRAGALTAAKSICGLSVMTLSGQVALHSPHCTQASSRKRRSGRSVSSPSAPVGQAATQARQSVQPALSTSMAPNGAPVGSAITSTGVGAARCSSRKASSSTSRLPPYGVKLAGCEDGGCRAMAASAAPSASGSAVSMVSTEPKPRALKIGAA